MQSFSSFLLAVVIAAALTPIARAFAVRVGALSYPNKRSVHTKPIPYLGGVAIYLASVVAVLIVGVKDAVARNALIWGGGVILLVGVIDDLKNLRPWQKIAGQMISAAIAVGLGVNISFFTDPFTGNIKYLGVFGIPLTVFWIIAFENLVNLSDGLDGLCAGIVAIASAVMVFASARVGVGAISVAAAAIAGSVLGFLPYNFHPASIFMGDAGAMYLGYALAVLSVQGLVKSAAALTVLAPVFALLVPISDAAFAIVRRFAGGVPVMQADHDHIHHRLLELGLSQEKAVLSIYSVSLIFGALGLFSGFMPVYQGAPITVVAIAGLYLFAHRAGLLTINAKRRQ